MTYKNKEEWVMKTIYSEQMYHPPRRETAARRSLPKRQEVEAKAVDAVPAFQKIKDAASVLGISQYCLRQLVRENAVPFIRSGQTYYVDMDAARRVLCEMAVSNMAVPGGGADGVHQ